MGTLRLYPPLPAGEGEWRRKLGAKLEKLGAKISKKQAENPASNMEIGRQKPRKQQKAEISELECLRRASERGMKRQQQDTRVCRTDCWAKETTTTATMIITKPMYKQLEQPRELIQSIDDNTQVDLVAPRLRNPTVVHRRTRNSPDKQTPSCSYTNQRTERRRSMTDFRHRNSISQLLSASSLCYRHLVTLLAWLLFILLLAHLSPRGSFVSGSDDNVSDSRWRPLVALAGVATATTGTELPESERSNFELISSQHSPLSTTLHFTRKQRPLDPGVHWRATRAAASGPRPNTKFVYDLLPSLTMSDSQTRQRGNDRRLTTTTTTTRRPPVNLTLTGPVPDLTKRSMAGESLQFDDDFEDDSAGLMFKVNERDPTTPATSSANPMLVSPTDRDEFVVGKDFLSPKIRDALDRYHTNSFTTLESTLGLDSATTPAPPVRFIFHNRTSGSREHEPVVVSSVQLTPISFNANQPTEPNSTNNARASLLHGLNKSENDTNRLIAPANFPGTLERRDEGVRRSVGVEVNPIFLANDVRVRSDLLIIASNEHSPVAGLQVKSLSGSYEPNESKNHSTYYKRGSLDSETTSDWSPAQRINLSKKKLMDEDNEDQLRWRLLGSNSTNDYVTGISKESAGLYGRIDSPHHHHHHYHRHHQQQHQLVGLKNHQQQVSSQWTKSKELDDGSGSGIGNANGDYDTSNNELDSPALETSSSSLQVAHHKLRQSTAATNERNGNNDISKTKSSIKPFGLLKAQPDEEEEAASTRWADVVSRRPPFKSNEFRFKKKVGLFKSAEAASPGIRVTIGEGTRPLMLNSRGLITAIKRQPAQRPSARPYNPSSLASQTSFSLSPIETLTATNSSSKRPPLQSDTWDEVDPPTRRRPGGHMNTTHLHSFLESGSTATTFTDLMDSSNSPKAPYATESLSNGSHQQHTSSTTPMSLVTNDADDTNEIDQNVNKTMGNSHLFTHNPPYKQHLLPAITAATTSTIPRQPTTSKVPPRPTGSRPTNSTKRPAHGEPHKQQNVVHRHELQGSENQHKVSHESPPYDHPTSGYSNLGSDGSKAPSYSTPMNQLGSSSISQTTASYGANSNKPTKLRQKIQSLLIGKIMKNTYQNGVKASQQSQLAHGQQHQQTASSPMPLLSTTVTNNVANLLAAKLSSLVAKPSPLFGSPSSFVGPMRPTHNKFKNRVPNPFVTPSGTNIHRRTTGVGPLLVSGFIYGLSMLPALMALTGINPLAAIGGDSGSSSMASSLAANRQGGSSPDKRPKAQLSSGSRPTSLLALAPNTAPEPHYGYLIPLLTAAAAGSSLDPESDNHMRHPRPHHLRAQEGVPSSLKSLYAPPPTILSPPVVSSTALTSGGDLDDGVGIGSDLSNLISIDELPTPPSSNEEDEPMNEASYLAFGSGKSQTRQIQRPSDEPNEHQSLALSSSQPRPDRAEMPSQRIRRHRKPGQQQNMAQNSRPDDETNSPHSFSHGALNGSSRILQQQHHRESSPSNPTFNYRTSHSQSTGSLRNQRTRNQVHPSRHLSSSSSSMSPNRLTLGGGCGGDTELPGQLFAPITPLRLTGAPTLLFTSTASPPPSSPIATTSGHEDSRHILKQQVSSQASASNSLIALHPEEQQQQQRKHQRSPMASTNWRQHNNFPMRLHQDQSQLSGGQPKTNTVVLLGPYSPSLATDTAGAIDHLSEDQYAQRRRRNLSNNQQSGANKWSLNLGNTPPHSATIAQQFQADGPKLQVGYTLNYGDHSELNGGGSGYGSNSIEASTDWRAIEPPHSSSSIGGEEIVRGRWERQQNEDELRSDALETAKQRFPVTMTTAATGTARPRINKWSVRHKGASNQSQTSGKWRDRGQKSGKSSTKTMRDRKSISSGGFSLAHQSHKSNATTERPPSSALDEGQSELQLAHSMAMGSRILNEPLIGSKMNSTATTTRRPDR